MPYGAVDEAEASGPTGYDRVGCGVTGMNERLNTIKAAKLGAVLGALYGLFQIATAGKSALAGSDQLARAAGSLIGAALLGAAMLALSAALINFISRPK